MSRIDTGITGHLFEEEVLGVLFVSWSCEDYISFDQALAQAKASQNWDPRDPSSRLANDLHAEVALALGLNDWRELRLYSSVGTPLDHFHGVDGFFEFCGRVVTIDLTVGHKEFAKADFVFHPLDLEEHRQTTASAIARALMRERRRVAC